MTSKETAERRLMLALVIGVPLAVLGWKCTHWLRFAEYFGGVSLQAARCRL